MDELSTTLTEATTLLNELSHEIALGVVAASEEAGAPNEAIEAGGSPAPQPERFKNEGLNKLLGRIRTAEETARAELEAKVREEVRKTRVDTAVVLCGEISKILKRLGQPVQATAPVVDAGAVPAEVSG